ncbi:HNH endonuclease [Nocardia sp. CNY236]|uniref:HNH endonuclease n=1 Tax=Nocardia sp. CNY236 TaxID=1169152 RepID=UPI00041D23B6|nr:HNH endonuclease domain-containing protein [Nocardia sp. CNY236]
MQFYLDEPTARTSWRLAILTGVNTRTYKFALGSALLEVGQTGREVVPLRELASRYAAHLVNRAEPTHQAPPGTVGERDFLAILGQERNASIASGEPTDRLVDAAVRSIPTMVMQKFHNLRVTGAVAHTFYALSGDGTNRSVRLSPELRNIATDPGVLADELAARWAIVEASFAASIGRGLVQGGVDIDGELSTLVTPVRRVAVTSIRGAIAGFQHGRCFYCGQPMEDLSTEVQVDHVFPFIWMNTGSWRGPNLNHVWNLVLACAPCNLAKSDRRPTTAEVERLVRRNDVIASSPHPLRRTIEITMDATGARAAQHRRRFMLDVVNHVSDRR